MIGGEMTGFDQFTMSLLTNEDILSMHKNARHSHQVWRRKIGGTEYILWTAAAADGGHYAALFNAGEEAGSITLSLSDLELYGSYEAVELWSGEKSTAEGSFEVSLASHGAKAWKLKSFT